jgi:hypothetical protein
MTLHHLQGQGLDPLHGADLMVDQEQRRVFSGEEAVLPTSVLDFHARFRDIRPLILTPAAEAMRDLAWCGVEPVVLRYLKLLKSVPKSNLSPAATLALMQRLATDSCRPEDYEVLLRIVEAHTELSAAVWEAIPTLGPSAPVPQATVKRPGATRTRRRHRR